MKKIKKSKIKQSITINFNSKDKNRLWVCIPFDCKIVSWKLLSNKSGSITIDIWKTTYSNWPPTSTDSITNGHKLILSSAQSSSNHNIVNWNTVNIKTNDILMFSIDKYTRITKFILILELKKLKNN